MNLKYSLLLTLLILPCLLQGQEVFNPQNFEEAANFPIDLNEQNFEREVFFGENGRWFVMFYTGWCPHSQEAMPILNELAQALDINVKIGRVDCDANPGLKDKYNIQAVPTFLYFDNDEIYQYQGPRTVDAWNKFINEGFRLKDAVKPEDIKIIEDETHSLLSQDRSGLKRENPEEISTDFQNLVELTDRSFDSEVKDQDRWFVMFYLPWCRHCEEIMPRFDELANALQGQVKLGKVDCDVEDRLRETYSIHTYPTFLYFSGGEIRKYEGDKTVEAWTDFVNSGYTKVDTIEPVESEFSLANLEENLVNQNMEAEVQHLESPEKVFHPHGHWESHAIIELTDTNFEYKVLKGGENKWFVMFYHLSCDSCEETMLNFHKLTMSHKIEGVSFGQLDSEAYPNVANRYSIQDHPTFLFFYQGHIRKYDGDKTLDAWTDFVNNEYTSVNTVEPVEQEPTPENLEENLPQENLEPESPPLDKSEKIMRLNTLFETDAIEELNDVYFNYQVLTDRERRWFVMFYDPWCPVCKEAMPKFIELANSLKGGDVSFGRVDKEANPHLRSRYSIQDHPAFLYLHKGESRLYKGDRTIEAWKEFLAREDQEPGVTKPGKNKIIEAKSSVITPVPPDQHELPILANPNVTQSLTAQKRPPSENLDETYIGNLRRPKAFSNTSQEKTQSESPQNTTIQLPGRERPLPESSQNLTQQPESIDYLVQEPSEQAGQQFETPENMTQQRQQNNTQWPESPENFTQRPENITQKPENLYNTSQQPPVQARPQFESPQNITQWPENPEDFTQQPPLPQPENVTQPIQERPQLENRENITQQPENLYNVSQQPPQNITQWPENPENFTQQRPVQEGPQPENLQNTTNTTQPWNQQRPQPENFENITQPENLYNVSQQPQERPQNITQWPENPENFTQQPPLPQPENLTNTSQQLPIQERTRPENLENTTEPWNQERPEKFENITQQPENLYNVSQQPQQNITQQSENLYNVSQQPPAQGRPQLQRPENVTQQPENVETITQESPVQESPEPEISEGQRGALIDLTEAIFDENVLSDNNQRWFVMFYAPWCPHCKDAMPAFEEFANTLEGQVFVARVDCVAHPILQARYSILGYPTFLFFYKGEIHQYEGPRTVEAWTEFVNRDYKATETKTTEEKKDIESESTSVPLQEPLKVPQERNPNIPTDETNYLVDLNKNNFNNKVFASGGDRWLVMFYAPWCPHCKHAMPTFKDLAKNLHGHVNVGRVDCDANPELRNRFSINGYPTFLFFSHGEVRRFDGERTIEAWSDFVNEGYKKVAAIEENVRGINLFESPHKTNFFTPAVLIVGGALVGAMLLFCFLAVSHRKQEHEDVHVHHALEDTSMEDDTQIHVD